MRFKIVELKSEVFAAAFSKKIYFKKVPHIAYDLTET